MKFFVACATLLLLIPQVLSVTVNTPTNVVECEPVLFTWMEGAPPYYLSLITAGDPNGSVIKQFPTQQGTSNTWICDLPAGSTFTISLKDSTGMQAFSDKVTVHPGSDTSCASSSSGVSGSETSSGVATVTSSTMSGSMTMTTPYTPANGGMSVISSATSINRNTASGSVTSSRASETAANAAGRASTTGGMGIAGIIALLAALF